MNANWLKDYLERSGDTEINPSNLVENEHGFCSWREHGDKLILINVYGDGEYWDSWAEKKGQKMGKKTILFCTKRNPKVFERKYGYKQIGTILEREISWAE